MTAIILKIILLFMYNTYQATNFSNSIILIKKQHFTI